MANDHYVPRFYLNNFEIQNKRKWIYSYKRNFKAIPKAIKSVACEDDFDLLKSSQNIFDSDFIAQILKQTEDDAAPILKKLITSNDLILSTEEREFLTVFIAYLLHRNPATRKKITNLHKATEIVRLKLKAEDKVGFEKYARESGFKENAEEIEELRQTALRFEEHFKLEARGDEFHDLLFLECVLGAQIAIPYVRSKQWILLNSTSTKEVFITSDNPVAVIPPPNHSRHLGVGFGNGWIYLPISPKRALLLLNEKPFKPRLDVKRHVVADLNNWIISAAHQSVFSNIYSAEIEKAFNCTREGENTEIIVERGGKPFLNIY